MYFSPLFFSIIYLFLNFLFFCWPLLSQTCILYVSRLASIFFPVLTHYFPRLLFPLPTFPSYFSLRCRYFPSFAYCCLLFIMFSRLLCFFFFFFTQPSVYLLIFWNVPSFIYQFYFYCTSLPPYFFTFSYLLRHFLHLSPFSYSFLSLYLLISFTASYLCFPSHAGLEGFRSSALKAPGIY